MTRWILALDGGGIRGAASARFLALLEAELGRPLSQVFDLYAGTSTGAIIAGALGIKGMSAREISSLYAPDNASTIMDKSPWDRVAGLIQSAPKYDGSGKRKVLDRYFGKTTLGEARRPTLIVAYDVEKRRLRRRQRTHCCVSWSWAHVKTCERLIANDNALVLAA
jgi:patatin-like phospholipase/acyl hydrolase